MSLARCTRALVLAALLGAALLAAHGGRAQGPEIDQAWVDGTLYDFTVTGPAPSGGPGPVAPLYVISPLDPTRPLHRLDDAETHGFGAHDHVLRLPGNGAFLGACDLTLVVPGAQGRPGANLLVRPTATPSGVRPLAYAADVGQGLEPLDSADAIERAASLGLVTLVDTKMALGCLAGPAEPAGCRPDPRENPYTWPGAAALGVSIAPCGGGWVRSAPYVIDCPLHCLAPLAPAATITISATPSSGYRFAGWSGSPCAGQGNPCTLAAPAVGAANVEADFAPANGS
jgi:hypothetical protein